MTDKPPSNFSISFPKTMSLANLVVVLGAILASYDALRDVQESVRATNQLISQIQENLDESATYRRTSSQRISAVERRSASNTSTLTQLADKFTLVNQFNDRLHSKFEQHVNKNPN